MLVYTFTWPSFSFSFSLHLEITGEYFSVWKAAHLEGPVRAAGVEERAGQAHLRHSLAHVLEQTVPEISSKLCNISNKYGIWIGLLRIPMHPNIQKNP
jgi:hypothetical protein